MFLRINGKSLTRLIGDPHLGRAFINGVPLHRRGEREAIQHEKLKELLNQLYVETGEKARTVVMMGDLFDQFEVESSVVFQAYLLIAEAAYANPDVDYVMLRGNHDVSRNTDLKSSLEILECMLGHIENILFINQVEYLMTRDGGDTLMFVPYDAFTSAHDLVTAELTVISGPIAAAFGHWDIDKFGESTHNLVPIDELKKVTKLIITGHVHSYQTRDLGDDAILMVTGSMMPYSHGEDHGNIYYVTVNLQEYNDAVAQNPKFFHDKSLRVLLGAGEEAPTGVDAFQFAYKKLDDTTDASSLEVKMEVFSFKSLYEECMVANGVPEETQDHYWSRYEELSNNASKT